MSLSTQPYKGSRDFYPEDKRLQNWIFSTIREVVARFAYQEYDGPFLEAFELYAAKTGEEIVNQQLYSFVDRGDRKVAIRPEMTPTLARMVAAKFQELPKPIRWFSLPNLWRYERPQRGRLREHYQLNVDVLGGDNSLADAEVIAVILEIFKAFGATHQFSVRLNNRRLMDHFLNVELKLAPEQAGQVMKALDAKDKIGKEKFELWLSEKGVAADAIAQIHGFLAMDFKDIAQKYPCAGISELEKLFGYLASHESAGRLRFDPSVQRGMDYYTGTVFEVYDESPENRRALCGGGRYDNLVGLFGKNQLSGMGFGMGDVGLIDFLQTHALVPPMKPFVDIFICTPLAESLGLAQSYAAELRAGGFRVSQALSVDGIGAQLKLASKLQAKVALILGADEIAKNQVTVKNLLSGDQQSMPAAELLTFVHSITK